MGRRQRSRNSLMWASMRTCSQTRLFRDNTFFLSSMWFLKTSFQPSKSANPSVMSPTDELRFSTEIINTLNKLRSNLVDALEPRLKTAESPQTSIEQLRRTLVGWQHALRVSRWLGTNEGRQLSTVAHSLVLIATQAPHSLSMVLECACSVCNQTVPIKHWSMCLLVCSRRRHC